MTKAKGTTPKPDDETKADRLAAEAAPLPLIQAGKIYHAENNSAEVMSLEEREARRLAAEADGLAAEVAAKAEAERLAAEAFAQAEKLRALIEEIEAHMHHELMPHTIEKLRESEGLQITEEGPWTIVRMAGVEATSSAGGVGAMGVWCNAARRHLAEAA